MLDRFKYTMRIDNQLLERRRINLDTAEKLIVLEGCKPMIECGVPAEGALAAAFEMRRIKDSVATVDANETLYTSRELTQIKQKPFETIYAQFKADYLVPVDSEGDTGAERLGWDVYDTHGEANIVDDEAADYAQAEITKEQVDAPVKTIGAYIEWNIQDIRRYQLAQRSQLSSSGASLTERKTKAAIKTMKIKEERIVAAGDATSGLLGFYNNSLLPTQALGASGGAWVTKDSAAIIADLNLLVTKVISASEGEFVPNTILLPVTLDTLISSKPYEGTAGPAFRTVKSFFLEECWKDYGIEIIGYSRVNWGASADTKHRIICYARHPDVVAQMYPQPLEVFGPYPVEGTVFRVKFRERHGGVHLRYPVACVQGEVNKT